MAIIITILAVSSFLALPLPLQCSSAIVDFNYSTSIQQDDNGLVLAPRRTHRRDPLNGFKIYNDGWNITDRHYWASVGFTSCAPLVTIAALWFLLFGVSFAFCCFRVRPTPKDKSNSSILPLIFLVVFLLVAILGGVVVYSGQHKFHRSGMEAVAYVQIQADTTSDNLKNVEEYLSNAKGMEVDKVTLPPNLQADMDQTEARIESSATTIDQTTLTNCRQIKNLMQSMRLALVILTVFMLLLLFLGLGWWMLGKPFLAYMLLTSGWIIVTATFLLCAIFLLLHNVTGDTCVAMNQWVQNPTNGGTSLDEILSCVDNATIQDTLSRTKQVTSQLVDIINTVITNVTNLNFAPTFAPMYYNQSGPLVPTLCNPFNPDLTNRACTASEVDLDNATQAWSGYMCQTNGTDNTMCVTPGRLSPTLYSQMSACVNASYGLYQYGPVVGELGDCSFVSQTFMKIKEVYCPNLRKYSRRMYVGMLMLAIAVTKCMCLCMVLWIRGRRELSTEDDGEDKQ